MSHVSSSSKALYPPLALPTLQLSVPLIPRRINRLYNQVPNVLDHIPIKWPSCLEFLLIESCTLQLLPFPLSPHSMQCFLAPTWTEQPPHQLAPICCCCCGWSTSSFSHSQLLGYCGLRCVTQYSSLPRFRGRLKLSCVVIVRVSTRGNNVVKSNQRTIRRRTPITFTKVVHTHTFIAIPRADTPVPHAIHDDDKRPASGLS